MKPLAELSPREIEHDNPEIRRTEEMANFLGQLYNREVDRGRDRHGDPLLRDPPRAVTVEDPSAQRHVRHSRSARLPAAVTRRTTGPRLPRRPRPRRPRRRRDDGGRAPAGRAGRNLRDHARGGATCPRTRPRSSRTAGPPGSCGSARSGGPDDGPFLAIDSADEDFGNLEAPSLRVDGDRLLLLKEECAAGGETAVLRQRVPLGARRRDPHAHRGREPVRRRGCADAS